MGHQIKAGDQGIYFTDGAWLVVNWCERFTPTVKPAGMTDLEWLDETSGSTNITAVAAEVADKFVPTEFSKAKEQGLLEGHYRHEIDERSFHQCRDFLKFAAQHHLDIWGSF